VNCTAVREALPEFALGVAPSAETRRVELHVETCAACRKEAIDLQRAVAAFGYALAPAEDSDAELETRVVSAVQAEVAAPAAHRHRHSRRSAFAVLAAAILVFALGTGAVFANHAERTRLEHERQALETQKVLEQFGDLVRTGPLADPGSDVYLGTLAATRGSGSGSALTVVTTSGDDQVIVLVDGVKPTALPLAVSVTDTKGHEIDLGSIAELNSSGGATFARFVPTGLGGFIDVIVRNHHGGIVLRGTLVTETSVSTPSP
jgi:hypothetical protein